MGVAGILGRGLGRALGRSNLDLSKIKFAEKVVSPTPPKMHEIGKTLAKHGTHGINGTSGYEKSLADDRVSHLVSPKFKLNVDEAVNELEHDRHLRIDYLNKLLSKVHKKDEVRTIIKYVKSTAADNLSPDQRAHLLMSCLDKLRYIDMIAQFFH
jgi:hypothetical protein